MKPEEDDRKVEIQAQWLQSLSIKVTSGSNHAYGNGRQQIEVQLDAIPLNGMSISEKEWATLRAVIEIREFGYRDLPKFSTSEEWGYTDTRDRNFDYYATANNPPLDPTPSSAGFDPKLIYVHSKAPGGTAIVLRAAITRDDGTEYYSDINSGSNYEIQLSTLQPPVYRFPEDYIWGLSHSEGDTTGGSNFLIEYSISLRHVGFSYAALDPNDTHGMIRWQSNEPNQRFASHVGMALVGTDPAVHYNTQIKLPNDFKAQRMKKETISDNTSSLVLLIQGDSGIHYDSASSKHQGPLRVMPLDRHGNGHRLSIRFPAEGTPLEKRTKLEVSVTPETQLLSSTDAQAGTEADSNVANISFFQVKGVASNTDNTFCHLYSNGHQQTYVDVVLRPVNLNGEPVQLRPEDKLKLRIVDYDSGASLPSSYQIKSSRSEMDQKFEYYPGTLVSDINPAQDDTVIRFWIKTTEAENRHIAAAIEINGTHYHTHQKDLLAGGTTVSGRSNSSATLAPHQQSYHYRIADFKLQRTDEYHNRGLDTDLYKLSLDNKPHRIVFLTLGPRDLEICQMPIARNEITFIYIYSLDEPREVDTSFGINWTHFVRINNEPGVVSAVRTRMLNVTQTRNHCFGVFCDLRDQYGNVHTIILSSKSNGNLLGMDNP